MNIVVCVKPVPDPEKYNLLKIDPKTKRLVREGIPTIVNPSDENAMEAALKLKEAHGGKVIVVSMCPLFSQDRIQKCLAMGADEAYIISDMAFAGADTFSTSYTIAKAIEKIGIEADLIITGNESADGATSQVSPQLGEWMELPHVANVTELSVDGDKVVAKKKTTDGFITYKVAMPAVIGVSRGCNKPRIASAMGIIKSKSKPLTVFTRADLDVEDKFIGLVGSPTQPGALIEPNMKRNAVAITGSTEEIAEQIIAIVKKAGINF